MSKYRYVYCQPCYAVARGINKDWAIPAVIYHDKNNNEAASNSCFQMFFPLNAWYVTE